MDFPLSFAQRRLWFLARLMGASRNYNVHTSLELTGPIDHTALAMALRDVVERHEPLRTVFPESDGEPVQRILAIDDLSLDLDLVETAAADLSAALATDGRHEFDLTTTIPIRARLHVSAPHAAVLSVVIHHIACDGWSMGPFLRDLSDSYRARLAGRPPALTDLPVSYRDYTAWQQEVLGREDDPDSVVHHQLTFWRQELADLPEGTQLPFDRIHPPVASYRGRSLPFELSAQVHARLTGLAQRTRSSLFMVIQSGIVAVLSRLGAGTDIALGTVVSGRTDEALEDLVGFFVNTLVLRTDTAGNPTFTELLQRVRETDLTAFDHQDLPFERVVEAVNPTRSANQNPLFQVMYSLFTNESTELDLAGTRARVRSTDSDVAKFDLAFALTESFDGNRAPAGIKGEAVLSLDVFDPETVQAIVERLARFLEVVSERPELRIADVDVFSDADLGQVLTEWNGLDRPLPATTVPELFRARLAQQPAAAAVVTHDGVRMSYAELDAASDALAARLAHLGVRLEDPVAVLVTRSAGLVVALLGILKSGASYVPLHDGYPPERMAAVLGETGAAVVVVDRSSRAVELGHQATVLDLDDLGDPAAEQALPGYRPPHIPPGARAYVMYTSGSSGSPKGIAVTHANLVSLVLDSCWDMHAGDSILLHSPYAFDISLHEIWVPLATGATVVVAPPGRLSPMDFRRLLGEHRVSCLTVTAGLFQVLVEEAPEIFAGLRQVWAGGDVVSSASVAELAGRYPDLEIHHLYGPTETTLGVVSAVVNDYGDTAAQLPLGRPLDNVSVYVLDDRLRPVAAGCIGELYIGGSQVAQGYLDQPAETAQRFVADPFTSSARIYRTGDLARWRRDGLLQFHGRSDNQVKLRGFRIELAEVEAAVARAAGVQQVLVMVREDSPGAKNLVAYLVGQVDQQAVRASLAATLPEFMVPSALVCLEAFPLSPNSKIDRRQLPVPDYQSARYEPARTAGEQALCDLFAEVLQLDRVGIHDNFFERGGHSLLATKLASRIRTVLNQEMSVRALFTTPTVAGLVESLETHRPARPKLRRIQPKEAALEAGTATDDGLRAVLTLRASASDGTPPLFCIHPGTGSSWCYLNLLRHLPPNQPVYGLQSPRLSDPGYRIDSVEQLAADYLRRVRERAPRGPYRLLGWSFGGVLAFAIAAMLADQQQEVELLALLDADPGELDIRRHLVEAVDAEPTGIGEPALRNLVDDHRRAGERYRPPHFPGDALVVTATADRGGDPAGTGWRDHVGGELREVGIEVGHHELLRPEGTDQFAPVLLDHLQALRSSSHRA